MEKKLMVGDVENEMEKKLMVGDVWKDSTDAKRKILFIGNEVLVCTSIDNHPATEEVEGGMSIADFLQYYAGTLLERNGQPTVPKYKTFPLLWSNKGAYCEEGEVRRYVGNSPSIGCYRIFRFGSSEVFNLYDQNANCSVPMKSDGTRCKFAYGVAESLVD